MDQKTTWLIVGAVALLAFFFWKMKSGGPGIQQIGGADSSSSADKTSMLTALTGLAAAKYQSDANVATTNAQLAAQIAAVNASVETTRINSAAQIAIANRQGKTTDTTNWLKTGGEIILASLPFIL